MIRARPLAPAFFAAPVVRRRFAWWLSVAFAALGASACSLFENQLERVKSAGELVVLTRAGPTTYYESPEGPAGFEYDLAKSFADHLGVQLRLETGATEGQLLGRLRDGKADFAAAGLTVPDADTKTIRYTPPYQHIRQQVIYRLGSRRPDSVENLYGREIEISTTDRHGVRLRKLREQYPELAWSEVVDRKTEELLQFVWEGLLDITIADSHLVALNRQYFPELQIAFNLHAPEGLAWAFRGGEDSSLYDEAVKFLESQQKNGELAQLIDRYYGPASTANFINMTVYQLRVQNRLPLYQRQFEKAGKAYNLDWRLLAAMGYQESYWDPNAVSPTGVRGIMMLTSDTAEQLGVKDRLDPAQSIDGGARYLRHILGRLPDSIVGPDRTWMALAAYNVGLYHLEDARIITQMQGGDPNRWSDVSARLPLLATRQWASRVKYGYARGREPVVFVNRVRAYYDVLVKIDEDEKARNTTDALKLRAPAI